MFIGKQTTCIEKKGGKYASDIWSPPYVEYSGHNVAVSKLRFGVIPGIIIVHSDNGGTTF